MSDRAITKGDFVRFADSKLGLYQQIYQITKDDVFQVVYVEPRSQRRVLYLKHKHKNQENWIPAYPSALRLAAKGKTGE